MGGVASPKTSDTSFPATSCHFQLPTSPLLSFSVSRRESRRVGVFGSTSREVYFEGSVEARGLLGQKNSKNGEKNRSLGCLWLRTFWMTTNNVGETMEHLELSHVSSFSNFPGCRILAFFETKIRRRFSTEFQNPFVCFKSRVSISYTDPQRIQSLS